MPAQHAGENVDATAAGAERRAETALWLLLLELELRWKGRVEFLILPWRPRSWWGSLPRLPSPPLFLRYPRLTIGKFGRSPAAQSLGGVKPAEERWCLRLQLK